MDRELVVLRWVLSVTSTVLLVLPGVTLASGWGAPTEISGTAGRVPVTAVGAAGGGWALAVGGPLALFPGSPQVPLAWSASAPGVGFGAPVPFTHGLASPLAISPGGRAMAVGGPRSPMDYFSLESASSRVKVGMGSVGGPLRLVATRGLRASLTIAGAVNDRGDAAIVFSRCLTRACSKRTIFASFRRAGGGFGKPLVLAAKTGAPSAAVAVNPRGAAIIAWTRSRTRRAGYDVLVRVRHADGSLTPVRIAGAVAPRPTLAVTLSPSEAGNLAWFDEGVSEGSQGGPYAVKVRRLDSRGALHGTRTLDRGTPSGHGGADAIPYPRMKAVSDGKGVLVAWTGFANGHYLVRGSHVVEDVASGLVLAPTATDTQLQDLATDASGDAIVAWVADGNPSMAGATLRQGPGGAFGKPIPLIRGAQTAAVAITQGPRAMLAAGGPFGINFKTVVSTIEYAP